MQANALYRAEGLDPLVALSDDGSLTAVLDDILVGWRFQPAPGAAPDAAPAITVLHGEDGWTCSGETFAEPITYRDPVATACSLIAHLYKAQTLIDHAGLVFHAGGIRIGAGLVLLAGHYRAGKSVFAACAAAAGLQVFSDDIIPLDDSARLGRAPGLAIRLRLPLPEGLGQRARDFIAAHNIAANPRYAYVCPPPGQLAPRNETAPIAGIVALRRSDGAKAELRRMRPADALGQVIRRNFAREVPAGRILEALEGLVDAVPCLKLTYDDPDEAVLLVREFFEGRLAGVVPDAPSDASEKARGKPKKKTALLDPAAIIQRKAGAHARQRDGEVFLTDADEQIIFHLNATGSAVWRLIEEPVRFGEIADTFAAGFPDRDPAVLAADLTDLIRRLSGSGLVQILRPDPAG